MPSTKDRLFFGDQALVFVNPRSASVLTVTGGDSRNEPTTALHTNTLTSIMVVDIRDLRRWRTPPILLADHRHGSCARRITQRRKLGTEYIGDAVMAVWVHDQTANLAADLIRFCVLNDISVATAEISVSLALPAPLRIGAGLNTGPAIVGGADYTALGDTVNAAFRLETATKSLGLGVAVGEKTYAALGETSRSGFVQRTVELKGYESPSTAWAISFEGLQEMLRKTGI